MEIALLIGVIFMIINVWVLVEYHLRLTDLNESVAGITSMQEYLSRNVFSIRSDINQVDVRIADKLDLLLTDVENARDDIRGVAALNASALDIQTAEELTADVSDLSQNELERLARKREFDERIANLRVELGYDSYGTHAEEILPEVKNLPHNIIPVSLYDLPDVEIAE